MTPMRQKSAAPQPSARRRPALTPVPVRVPVPVPVLILVVLGVEVLGLREGRKQDREKGVCGGVWFTMALRF